MDSTLLRNAALGLTMAFALVACSQKPEAPAQGAAAPVAEASRKVLAEEMKPQMDASMPAPPPPPPQPATVVTAATVSQQMGSSSTTYVDSERKFIRTAQARFQVKDVYVAALGIEDTVASHGGFVVKNNITTDQQSSVSHPAGDNKLIELAEYAVQGQLIVRVPSAKTQEFLRAIVSHIVFLDQRNFDARDAQFDLLRQQLDMIRNQETQRDIGQAVGDGGKLGQKTDAIATRNEVKAARDSALIAKKEFEDQVAFSTIELKLHQPVKVVQTERVDVRGMYRQFRPGFFPRLAESLRDGWSGLLELILALVTVWPVLLIISTLAYAVLHVRRRRRQRAK